MFKFTRTPATGRQELLRSMVNGDHHLKDMGRPVASSRGLGGHTRGLWRAYTEKGPQYIAAPTGPLDGGADLASTCGPFMDFLLGECEMPAQPTFSQLTPREVEVLKLIAIGLSTKQIAATLDIAFKTAACHRSRIMDKLEIHQTANLTRYAIRQGYVDTGGDSSPSRTHEELFNQVKATYARYQQALNNYSAFLKERETMGLECTDSSDGARRLRQAERATHAEYHSALLALKQFLFTG